MDSRHGNVISDPDIARGIPPNLQIVLIVGIEDEKYFGLAELLLLIA